MQLRRLFSTNGSMIVSSKCRTERSGGRIGEAGEVHSVLSVLFMVSVCSSDFTFLKFFNFNFYVLGCVYIVVVLVVVDLYSASRSACNALIVSTALQKDEFSAPI